MSFSTKLDCKNYPLELIIRTVTQQQYLFDTSRSALQLENVFDYAIFIDDGSQEEGCYYLGRCIQDTSLTMGEIGISGHVAARVGLIPLSINVSLANILPPDTTLPLFQFVSVLPDRRITYIIPHLASKYCSDSTVKKDYGLFWREKDCWLVQ